MPGLDFLLGMSLNNCQCRERSAGDGSGFVADEAYLRGS